MKRDWEIVRHILVTVEAAPQGARLGARDFADQDARAVFGHVQLLTDAGFLKAKLLPDHTGVGGGDFVILSLPWPGHDLLATIRSQGIWEKIKSTAKDKGVELTFEAVKVFGKLALEQIAGG